MSPIESIPPEILSHIISFVGEDLQQRLSSHSPPDYRPLLSTSLIARAWRHPSQTQLLSTVYLLEPSALEQWIDCPVSKDAFTTRTLVLGVSPGPGRDTVQQAVERCKGLRALRLPAMYTVSTGLLALPALAGLKELQMVSNGDCSTNSKDDVFPFALASLHLFGSFVSPYPSIFFPLLLDSSLQSIQHLTVTSFVIEDPHFTPFFTTLAPRLRSLRLVLPPPLSILLLVPNLTNLQVFECDDLWDSPGERAASVLLAFATTTIPITTLRIGNEDFSTRDVLLNRVSDVVVAQMFKRLKKVVFASGWTRECSGFKAFVEVCERKGVAVE